MGESVTKKKRPVIERMPDGSLRVRLLPHQRAARSSTKQIAGLVGSRACGKSIYMSVEAFLEIIAGKRVIVMAQNYKSLKINIFREIVNRFREAGLTPTVNYSEMSIKWGKGELFGFTYAAIDSTRGATEVSLLLLDELAYAPPDLLATVSPCLRGADGSRIRFGTSPKKGSIWNKWFKDTSVEKDLFTATMFDNTELSEEDYELQKKAIKDDMQYRQEILGEILDDDVEFGIIHAADYPMQKLASAGIRRLGIDCAGSGCDNNVFVVSDTTGILDQVKIQIADTYRMFSQAKELIERFDVKFVAVDCTGGFGNGLYDMLQNAYKNTTVKIHAVNFGSKSTRPDYANARTDMYFNLVERIRDNGFWVGDPLIREELQYVTYDINAAGKTFLCPKSTIKALIGRSPDTADALALSQYDIIGEGELSPEESLDIAMSFVGI